MTKETRFDKKKAKTKDKIFNAAVELFLKQGYDQTTIEQIANKADVAKGTFFIHFPTKSAVLFFLGEKRLSLIEELLAEKLKDIKSSREKLFSLLNMLAQINEDSKEITALIIKEVFKTLELAPEKANQDRFKMLLVKIFEEGQQQGEFERCFNAHDAADIIISIYFFTLFQWLGGALSRSLAEEYQIRLKIMLEGIS